MDAMHHFTGVPICESKFVPDDKAYVVGGQVYVSSATLAVLMGVWPPAGSDEGAEVVEAGEAVGFWLAAGVVLALIALLAVVAVIAGG